MRMPRRRDMRLTQTFDFFDPDTKQFFLNHSSTHYWLTKGGPANTNGFKEEASLPIKVRWRTRILHSSELQNAKEQLREVAMTVEGKRFELTYIGDKPCLKGEDFQEAIKHKTVRERDIEWDEYSFDYPIPGSENFPLGKEVEVSMSCCTLIPATIDQVYYFRVTCPTKNFAVTLKFPEGLKP